jgi:hypothetical protein
MLLTMQRSNAVGVLLGKLKLTPAQARARVVALLEGEEGEGQHSAQSTGPAALGEEDIVGLLRCMPTAVRAGAEGAHKCLGDDKGWGTCLESVLRLPCLSTYLC